MHPGSRLTTSQPAVFGRIARVAVANLALPAAAFAVSPILGRLLGVDGRGTVSAALAPLMLATALATMGLPDSVNFFVARRRSMHRAIAKYAFQLTAISGMVATFLTLMAAPVLSGGDSSIATMISLAGLSCVPTLLIGVTRGAAQGMHRWDLVNAEKYLTAGSRVVALVILALTSLLTPFSAVVVMVLTPALGGVAYIRLRREPHVDRHIPSRASVYTFSSKVWLGSLSGVLLARIDQVLLTPLAGTFQLGLYAAAVNVGDIVPILSNAVRDVIFSTDARNRDNDLLTRAARLSFLLSGGIAVVLAANAFWILPLLFGEEFRQSVVPAAILSIVSAMGVPGSVAGASLGARGRPEIRSIGLAISTTCNVVALVVLVPSLGAVGAALAMLAGVAIASNWNIYHFSRLHHVPWWRFYLVNRQDIRTFLVQGRRLRFAPGNRFRRRRES